MRDAGMLQAGPHFHGFGVADAMHPDALHGAADGRMAVLRGAAADVEVLRRSLDAAAGKTLPP